MRGSPVGIDNEAPPLAYMYWPMVNKSEAEGTAIRCTRRM